MIEGKFRKPVPKVSPALDAKVSPQILPIGNYESHAHKADWEAAKLWLFYCAVMAIDIKVSREK